MNRPIPSMPIPARLPQRERPTRVRQTPYSFSTALANPQTARSGHNLLLSGQCSQAGKKTTDPSHRRPEAGISKPATACVTAHRAVSGRRRLGRPGCLTQKGVPCKCAGSHQQAGFDRRRRPVGPRLTSPRSPPQCPSLSFSSKGRLAGLPGAWQVQHLRPWQAAHRRSVCTTPRSNAARQSASGTPIQSSRLNSTQESRSKCTRGGRK